ncbi:MAG: class I SAM-dependent RNA methyltransferase [Lachnospiraceae bacterium]|nr:class I SAM-dependent RNA methyltransferase [Lachnospiraceae bacterium]
MNKYKLTAVCHFGMEAPLKREITDLGYEILSVDDGRVTFAGDAGALARANIFLRTAERVLLIAGSFRAGTYEELFQGTKALPWEEFIPENGRFWVTKVATVKSTLFSPRDIQSVMKKGMVERMKMTYHRDVFAEDGDDYPVRVFLYKDEVVAGLDTSGTSLHKRGYRTLNNKAPIAENLAAGLIMLTPWKRDRILVDPFCGSGTFPIEAALMAANIAPGMNREFTAERWSHIVPKSEWYRAVDEASSLINVNIETDIQGYDIDESCVRIARENAKAAGVEHLIHFQRRDVRDLSHPGKYGFIITNPPYGERIGEASEIGELYRTLGERYKKLNTWSMGVITSYENAESDIGQKATRNRKLYNGMIKTYFYQFMGPKPPAKRQ